MPRDATPTERAVCACSREKFRYDDDFEMLDPAQMVDPFKIWENVNEYLRLYCQGQKKVEAAEKSFWLPPQGSWKRGLWSWTRAPKQMWSMAKNPALEQSLDHLRPLFLEPLTKNCLVKTQGGFLANVPQTCQVGDLVVILHGWNSLFLLRPSPRGLLLIAECYVYGIMHGFLAGRGYAESTFDDVRVDSSGTVEAECVLQPSILRSRICGGVSEQGQAHTVGRTGDPGRSPQRSYTRNNSFMGALIGSQAVETVLDCLPPMSWQGRFATEPVGLVAPSVKSLCWFLWTNGARQ